MKILFVSSLYAPNLVGGAERVVQRLATAFAKRHHEIVVLTCQPRGQAATATIDGVRIYYLPTRNIYRAFADAKPGLARKALWHLIDSYNPLMKDAVSRILDREKPDVINSHNLAGFSVAVWAAARAAGIPIVHSIHDPYLLCPKSSMFSNGRNCQRRCFDCYLYSWPRSRATDNVDVVVGVSRFILQRHRDFGLFGRAEPRVIYNATSSVEAGPKSRGSGPMRFGYLGQIRATKGLHVLIEALIAMGGGVELWISGKGDAAYEAELKRRTAGIGRIAWLGYSDLKEFFRSIDVLVVPSLWNDTAPAVILEAFSHGVPVLGSNRGGIPELITAETGWTFDPEKPDELQNALRRCIDAADRLPAMSVSAQALAAERGQSSRVLDEYLSAYEFARHVH